MYIFTNQFISTQNNMEFLKATMMGPNAMRVAEELASCLNVNENMRILDLGCGGGLSTLLLTQKYSASDVTVFHGGSSTLMTCIACGTPAVVVPSIGEQEDNGNVLAQFGAGIVLDKETLTPAIMAEAMQKIISDSNYRTGAQRLKVLGERYGGADAAADWAEQLVRGNRK
jgi:UDP-N-acetylglucosamine:LPS N-acetylglucosamine transferase